MALPIGTATFSESYKTAGERAIALQLALILMENIKKEVDLGDYPDEASKKIGEEIEARAKAKAEGKDPDKEELSKKEDEKPPVKPEKEEAGKEEEKPEKKEEGKEDEEKPNRTPSLMPIYKHKLAEGKWNEEKEKMTAEIAELKKSTKNDSKPDRSEKIKSFAEKHGFDEDFVKDLTELVGSKSEVSEEIKQKLDTLEAEKRKSFQDTQFSKEVEKDIVPLLEADGVPAEKRPKVLQLLKDLAFTEEYAKTPLRVIYRGSEEFDTFKIKGRKSAEGSRGGSGTSAGGGEKSWRDMSDEEFMADTDEKAKQDSRNSKKASR